MRISYFLLISGRCFPAVLHGRLILECGGIFTV